MMRRGRNPKAFDQLVTDNWPRRRRWMSVILIWMVGNAQYLIVWGSDNALHQNALITILGAIVSIICFYVFGAVWDDNNKRDVLYSDPYQPDGYRREPHLHASDDVPPPLRPGET